MRRFRSISDYLSLGTLKPADMLAPRRPALMGARVVAGKPFKRSDLVVAERLSVRHIREAVRQLAHDRVPPMPNTGERVLHGYIDAADGGLVVVKVGTRPEDVAGEARELVWRDPDPAAAGFGPFYEVSAAPQDMAAICGEDEFVAGLASGEFRVAGTGRILVRPPET